MPRLPHPTNRKSIPGQLALYGEDFPLKTYCRRCGGRLKNPNSIALGIGPTCLEKQNRSLNHDVNGNEETPKGIPIPELVEALQIDTTPVEVRDPFR